MRPLLPLVLLLAAPAALAHGGSHGLELTDLRLSFRPLDVGQQFSFTITNDDSGPATHLKVKLTFVGERVAEERSLPSIPTNESAQFTVVVPQRASAYGCAQAIAFVKASEMVCAFTDGVTLP